MKTLTESQYAELQQSDFLMELWEVAGNIFEDCGAAQDFCLQSAGNRIVFGGTNRLCFSARIGWHADEPYCTSRFLSEWINHPLNPQRIMPATALATPSPLS